MKQETKITESILRWAAYGVFFAILLSPWIITLGVLKYISLALILGHFGSQSNALIYKDEER